MTRRLPLLLLLLAGVLARPSAAQISADQVRERYDKQTKGGSVDEWARDMNSDDPLERLKGVKSLSTSTDPAAVPYLVQALGDPDMRVKAKAIDACGNVRAVDATPVLIQQLFLRGTDEEVKQRILAALGKIGDQRAAQPIIEFLSRDLDMATRGTALFALGDIADPGTLEFLETYERTEPHPTLKRLASEARAKVRYQQTVKQTEVKQPLNTFLDPEQPPQQ
ncbi:MAG: HEAT repeat domain-containing protein [Deltaproteobacteria bacterium]|nr:HEAT repeat domain-containing protein [Deltaproteobacteria bacterium]